MEYAAPKTFNEFISCAFYAVALVVAVIALFKQLKGKQASPPNESLGLTVELLSLRVAKMEVSVDNVKQKMETDKQEILKAGEDRIVKVHDRINEVLAAVCRLEGRLDAK